MLGIDPIASFAKLRQGEAGELARALAGYRTRADLESAALPPPEVDWPRPVSDRSPAYRRKMLAVVLRAMMAAAYREAARGQHSRPMV